MERERLLTALSLIAALLPLLSSRFVGVAAPMASGRAWEQAAWRRLWLPLLPTLLWVAYLVGWALQEPDAAEGLPVDGRVLTGIGALLCARGLWRAWRMARVDHRPLIGVVGLAQPAVHLDPTAAAALDPDARAAALAHEGAHVRHWDPLRIWLATIATDLQLGVPSAQARWRIWRHALELARDEEAREGGAGGPELASAILKIMRLEHRWHAPTAATLEGDAAMLRDRVDRLLAAPVAAPPRRWFGALVVVAVLVLLATGVLTGETIVGGLLRWGDS